MSIAYQQAGPRHAPAADVSLDMSEETSLIDLLQAREQGLGFRDAAALFSATVAQFQSVGHNLYGRMLLEPSDAEATVDDPVTGRRQRMIILASNNYLGLTGHAKVVAAAKRAASQWGTGSGSSPLLVGTFPVTCELEKKLAAHKGTEDCSIFSTGYSANIGVISAVATKSDVVILDRLAHASMVDGARLSGAQVKVFKHNNAAHLDRVLRRTAAAATKLVCVEGIYSMDGDIAPLDQIVEVCRHHGAILLVDEAHSTGVLGPDGKGAAAYFGIEGQIDLHVGTLSKALGACGGFVAGSHDMITYLRYFARSGMFSTAPSPMVLAAASAALDVMVEEPERRERLWENCRFMHEELERMGFQVSGAPSPIIPVIVGTMHGLRQMTLALHRRGICINAVPFPAVPHGSERLRISLTANHTRDQIQTALDEIKKAGRAAGVI